MISWVPDVELPGYRQLNIPSPGARTYPGEPDHEVVATLVRRSDPGVRRAVLYVHGWSDYFFQTHLAEAFEDWGYDFYALDLRRYGRSAGGTGSSPATRRISASTTRKSTPPSS